MLYKDGKKAHEGHTVSATVDGKAAEGMVVGIHWNGKSKTCLLSVAVDGALLEWKSEDVVFVEKKKPETVASPGVAQTGAKPAGA